MVVLESGAIDLYSQNPVSTTTKSACRNRARVFGFVLAAHATVVALIVAIPGESSRAPETEPLVAVFIRPAVLITDDPSLASAPPRMHRRSSNAVSTVAAQDADPPVITTIGVGTMAPHAENGSLDSSPFARAAGLRPGEGATVVLRVEVLGSGDVGRVEIDVSGGSADIDRAAVAYARLLPWVGGMIDGRPATLWIRWGVRLESNPV
jgi:TonB family protein